jgi:two-component system cell cycle sensor histidine kinase/response regulator CckA
MNLPLRVLHLEDNPSYSELVRAKLAADGFDPELVCVETREGFAAALDQGTYDLIIADYFLPTYDGIKAVKLAREKAPETPILLVSGTIGEDAAVESLKAGATDYVLKHWPERLIPAVRRALKATEERRNRVLAETALIRREKLFRALSDNALDIVTIVDQVGTFTYNSLSITRMLGHDPEKLKGQNAFTLIHPEDVPKAQAALQKAVRQPELAVTVQFRFQHLDGSWRHLESIGRSLLDDPEIAGVVVNSRDITEGRRAENYNAVLSKLGLQLSSATTAEEAGKVIVEAADNLFVWDACTLHLYSTEEDKIFPVLSIDTIQGEKLDIPPADIDPHPSPRTRRILGQGAELILREEPVSMTDDGIAIGDKARPSASLMFVPVRNRTRVIGILSIQSYQLNAYTEQDLGTLQTLADYCGGALERIRVERALRESERRVRHLFAGSPDAIFVEDADGLILDANPAAGRLHGVPHEQLIGRNAMELVPPGKREQAHHLFEKLVRDELHQIESVSLTVDGREVPVEIRTSQIDYADKRALLLHVRDISERRKAEEALRGSEIRFHSVWENSVDGMRLTDAHGTIVAVNEAFCRLVEMEREELEGQLFTLTHATAEDPEKRLGSYRRRFQERAFDQRIERRMILRSGKHLDLEVANSFVEVRGQRPLLLGLFRDITEQKRLGEQLRQSQKMDAIGQLAGGVAHDFNNILTVIQGHASLLRSYGELNAQAAQSAEQISQASERAAGLTRQLLTFSRRQMMQPKQLDFNVVVSNMTRMLGRILGEDIALQFNYSPNLPLVQADVGMVEQVLLNLAVNSRDAMPLGGRLTIGIAVREVRARDLCV